MNKLPPPQPNMTPPTNLYKYKPEPESIKSAGTTKPLLNPRAHPPIVLATINLRKPTESKLSMLQSALRRTLRFLPVEDGKQHTMRIFKTAEAIERGEVTWQQINAEEQCRREHGLVQERRPREPYDDRPGRTVASCDYRPRFTNREEREVFFKGQERRRASPVQKPMTVREELNHPKQLKLQ